MQFLRPQRRAAHLLWILAILPACLSLQPWRAPAVSAPPAAPSEPFLSVPDDAAWLEAIAWLDDPVAGSAIGTDGVSGLAWPGAAEPPAARPIPPTLVAWAPLASVQATRAMASPEPRPLLPLAWLVFWLAYRSRAPRHRSPALERRSRARG